VPRNPPRDPEEKDKEKEEEFGTESPISSKKLSAFVNSLSDVELKVLVMNSDFLHAARTIKPSVSRSELDHYEELGEEFNDVTS
jgi:SpoVK/Ycf46/Vps4 family AAA+-type ATPase